MPVHAQATAEITTFGWVPPFAQGYVKDLRIRWAMEEIGAPYREHLIGKIFGEPSPDHLADQPFGQVPVYKEDGVTLFESGAILIHIGARDERLLPRDASGRGRAISWMFAALNSVEPTMQALVVLGVAGADSAWKAEAVAAIRPFAEQRLARLSNALGDREWLEDRFTIGDLLMIDVLRTAPDEGLVAAHPNLSAYVERGTSRPAFKAAMAAQMAVYQANEQVGA
jgi:glutathione S-transferase